MQAEDLSRLLSTRRFRYQTEVELCNGIESVLTAEGVVFQREHRVNQQDRFDFWLPVEGLVVEVKTKGSLQNLLIQLSRYVNLGKVNALMVATTRRTLMDLPHEMNGKPIHACLLNAGIV
jgi:hypothetical protein